MPTSARRRLHEQILERWRAANPHVARERSAIVMAGPPGAGKSSSHDQLFRGRDRRRWRELDADVFKRYLLEAALADGTLEEMLPPELRAAQGEDSRFYPFELSALVHRESTDVLFAAAERDAIADGENLIIDGTLAWKAHAERLLRHLQQAGYTIHVVDVEAPQHVAAERIVTRWRQGLLRALSEPADPVARLGGRWVPATAVDALFTEFRQPDHLPLRGRSVTQVNALEVSEANTAVGCYDLYRTDDASRGAEHIERRERSTEGGELHLTWTAASTPVE
ncbi:zeta toxin family protein [Rhodococcus sp. AH-ZY2]|uniref:zeta toxin family protein n=1 Tax=Rhodococcus sp. AH-ZY2 TaxID=3047468 RepID=UPI0027E07921|nr:zeta toxin family protein [Rhodococcus sp. AH-ZY2]WML66376.1 zeta toxin family protein [Rhodococcus sp. AH-ZY2]